MNIALYGPGGKRWTLTERRRHAVECTPSALQIGPSALSWDGNALTIRIDEFTFPFPSRVRGVVRLHPHALPDCAFALDTDRRHRWQPLAPCANVEVALTHPKLDWIGPGYLDCNAGDVPLEDSFSRWHWSRAPVRDGTVILYDIRRRDGEGFSLALHADRVGGIRRFDAPPEAALPTTGWRIARHTRVDAGQSAIVAQTFEDTPFYARSLVSTCLAGERVHAMHESLSLDRFRSPLIRALLPFRMPRARR